MKKLSAEFAQELESAKYQQQRFDDLGLFPNNSGVSWDKYEKANPGAASIVAALKKLPTSLMAHSMQDSKTNDIFQTQIELAMLGKTTVKDALDAAEKSRVDQRETLFPTK
jgi:ABC-type glycerol-3-phosphate transport system substrate-binding protein